MNKIPLESYLISTRQNVPYIYHWVLHCKQINLLVTRGFIYWFVWLVTVYRFLVGFVTTIWFLVGIHFVTPIWFFVMIITAAIFLVPRWFVAILVLGRWIGIFLVILILKNILNKLQHWILTGKKIKLTLEKSIYLRLWVIIIRLIGIVMRGFIIIVWLGLIFMFVWFPKKMKH